MAEFRWDLAEDARLRREYGIGFEEIIRRMETADLLRIVPNPRYPGQEVAEVLVGDYVYRVPMQPEAEGTVRLITLYPSRRATRAWRQRSDR